MSAMDPTRTTPGLPGLVKRSPSQDDARQGDNAERQLAWAREMERAQMSSWFKPMAAQRDGAVPEGSSQARQAQARVTAPVRAPRVASVVQAANANPAPSRAAGAQQAASTRSAQTEAQHSAREVPSEPEGAKQIAPTERSTDSDEVAVPIGAPATAGVITGAVLSALHVSTSASAKVVLAAGAQALVPFASASAAAALLPSGAGLPSPSAPMPTLTSRLPGTGEEEAESSRTDSVGAGSEAARPAEGTVAPVRLHEESTPRGQAVWIAMRADDATLAAMLPQWIADLQRGMRTRGERLHQVVCNGQVVWRDGTAKSLRVAAASGNANPFMFDSIDSKEA